MRFVALVLIVLWVLPLSADEARERKVRAALALAGAKPAPTVAPAPRPAPKNYADGHKTAIVEAQPLVVFVSCPSWPVEGAIVAKTEGPFAGVQGPAVVVGFPQGDRLFIDATVPCEPAKVLSAVRAAQKKIDVPPAQKMPAAPKPLNWMF